VGLIQRVLDGAGIPTISLTLVREITEQVKPSRALYVEHPFGHTLGDVGDKLQRWILLDCLEAAVNLTEPGTIRHLPYRWTKNDLRERQLQKKAH
jgi:D-proline reductase (dithiol) PrdB